MSMLLEAGLGGSRRRRRGFAPVAFSPTQLFANGEQGAWYDPSDFSTLYQNSAGTTPVTALGQPVGLVLDKSQGALSSLGSNVVVNGSFATDTSWTKGAGWTISGGTANFTTTSLATVLTQANALVAGKSYLVTLTVVSVNAGSGFAVYSGTTSTTPAGVFRTPDGTTGTFTGYLVATESTLAIRAGATMVGGRIDNITVREVPGNHARQTTDAARPTLQARSNLLIRTEEFENATWTKTGLNAFGSGSVANTAATTDPLGTNTADFIQENTANSRHNVNTGTLSGILNANYTFSVYLKAAGRTWAVISYSDNAERNTWFDLANGTLGTVGSGVTATITAVGNGWYRCVCSKALGGTGFGFNIGIANANGTISYLGDGTSGMYVWGAQGEYNASATTYQRVTTATDYADIGLPRALQFDGTDDFLVTAANLNMTASDEVTVAAGVFKAGSIGTARVIYELSANISTNTGTIQGTAPSSTLQYTCSSNGTAVATASTNDASFAAPHTGVITSLSDISADNVLLRINGTQVGDSTSDQGTGNYGSYLLYIGRRGGTSFPFIGRIHQLIVRGALTSGAQLTSTEQWVAQKTGVTL